MIVFGGTGLGRNGLSPEGGFNSISNDGLSNLQKQKQFWRENKKNKIGFLPKHISN